MSRSSSPQRTHAPLLLWIPLGIFVCLLIAGCGATSSTGGTATATATATTATSTTTTGTTTIAMATSSFSGATSVTIKAGQTVTFKSDGTHILVIGMHGQFSAQNGAPGEFNTSKGLNFSPGDAKTVTFPTAGTYSITCTIHPSMQATVVVTS